VFNDSVLKGIVKEEDIELYLANRDHWVESFSQGLLLVLSEPLPGRKKLYGNCVS
jgi:hypothetical protein